MCPPLSNASSHLESNAVNNAGSRTFKFNIVLVAGNRPESGSDGRSEAFRQVRLTASSMC